MKKCLAIAALLLASNVGAAQAQYSFEYNGRTITIDPDRGTVSIPGVYDNTPKKKRPRGEEGDLDRTDNPLKRAPHTAASVADDTWAHKYSRSLAAYPPGVARQAKYWPPVARVDNVYGDRHLFCSCIPVADVEALP